MKAETFAYSPAGIGSLFNITPQLQRSSKWRLAHTKTGAPWEDKFSLLPAVLPWPFGFRPLKTPKSLFPRLLYYAPKSHHNHVASTAGTFISLCWRQGHPNALMYYTALITVSQQCAADMGDGGILSWHLSHSHESIRACCQKSSLVNWQPSMLNNWVQLYKRFLSCAPMPVF